MSEEEAKAEDGDESSMEDILSSIRDILSDEEEGSETSGASETTAKGDSTAESTDESEPEVEMPAATQTEGETADDEAEPEGEASAGTQLENDAAVENEQESEIAAETISEGEASAKAEPNSESVADAEQQPVSEGEPVTLDPSSPPATEPAPTPIPPVMEAILELTPDMIATDIMSKPTAKASTDVLSELAAAILDRRDLAVDTSRNEMTLEGIVREMLKPILREWLDRNLPYLIERLVKREIDLMVNRAERLED